MTKLITIPSKIIPGLSSLTSGSSSSSSSSSNCIKKRLRAIADLPTNRTCSDCPAKEPTWASLQIMDGGHSRPSVGLLCCDQCCSHHSQLGNDVCIVKNIHRVEEWSVSDVEALERSGGNGVVNLIWEAGLSAVVYDKMTVLEDPEDDANARREFIIKKYKDLRYFDPELYKTQLYNNNMEEDEDQEDQEIILTMPLVGGVKPTKNKPGKRAKSFDSTSIRHQNHALHPRRGGKKNSSGGRVPLRRSATFGGGESERDSSSSSGSDEEGHNNNNKTKNSGNRNTSKRIEMEDDSSRRFGYSLPVTLGVQRPSKPSALSLGSNHMKKKIKQRRPSAERKRRGSSSSSSKYTSIQETPHHSNYKEELGYGSDSSRSSRGSMGGGSSRSSASNHSSRSTSGGGGGRRLSRRERRRSSSASSSSSTSKYIPMESTLSSPDDIGSSSMDASMESMGSISGSVGRKSFNLPARGSRWGSSKSSNGTASTASDSSSLSTFGSGSNSFGRWSNESSSQLLSNDSKSESWNMLDNITTTVEGAAPNNNDRWSADCSSSSQGDRWNDNNSSFSCLASRRRRSPSPAANNDDRWYTDSSNQSSASARLRTSDTTTTLLDQSQATQQSQITLPRCNRRKSTSTAGRAAGNGGGEGLGVAAAPRMPSRVFSDCSGDEMGTDDDDNEETQVEEPEQPPRRISLPSFATTKLHADEDSIQEQYGSSKPRSASVIAVSSNRNRSLGMKKEKTGPKYGIKMGYGFDSSKESDGEEQELKIERNEKVKPPKTLESCLEEEEDPIDLPALGQFLEKSQESVPNKVLGGRSLGSGTKSSDEDILGIGPASSALKSRPSKSWMDREKMSTMYHLATETNNSKEPPLAGSSADKQGSLADHLNYNGNIMGGKTPNDMKSYSGCSFGSNSTTSSEEQLLKAAGVARHTTTATSGKPPLSSVKTKMQPLVRLEAALQRSSLHTAVSDESSSLAASCFSRSSHESSLSGCEEFEEAKRRAFTMAILKASGQAA